MMNVTTYTDGVSSGNVDASVVEVLEHEIEISITNWTQKTLVRLRLKHMQHTTPFTYYNFLLQRTHQLQFVVVISREGLKFFQWTFFLFFMNPVDGHTMYFVGSVVGKASTIRIEISPTSFLIFTGGGGQKVQNSASSKTSLNFEAPAFENWARYPNIETKVQRCDDHRVS